MDKADHVLDDEGKSGVVRSSGPAGWTCLGKVRSVSRDEIRVSLFTDDGEVIGLLARDQFPVRAPRAGQVFHYQATVLEPGRTEVAISMAPARDLAADDVSGLWQEIDQEVPFDAV